ncbi:Uncharacterised protein [Bordetella pertussis]|nr:Uncharacterised protein [Bordetella pertussis]
MSCARTGRKTLPANAAEADTPRRNMSRREY